MESNETFRIRTFRFMELAMLYFPDTSKEFASRLLRKNIRKSTSLSQDLELAGLCKYAKILTPKQVSIIVSYLGEP